MSTEILLEVANSAIAAGASHLAMLLGVEVDFGQGAVCQSTPDLDRQAANVLVAEAPFTAGVEGATTLAFTADGAAQMIDLALEDMELTHDDRFGELGLSALGEVMNQFISGLGRSLEAHRGRPVTIGAPALSFVDADVLDISTENPGVVVAWNGRIAATASRLFWIMTPETVASFTSGPTPDVASAAEGHAHVSPASTSTELGRLADVKLDVSVELGRNQIPIQELLALDEGGVIRLGRRVGEPVDLMVNGLATARGEIVVVDGRLGLRVTELIT